MKYWRILLFCAFVSMGLIGVEVISAKPGDPLAKVGDKEFLWDISADGVSNLISFNLKIKWWGVHGTISTKLASR